MKYFRLYMNYGKVLMVKTKQGTNCLPKVIIVLLAEHPKKKYKAEVNLERLKTYQDYNICNKPFYSFNLYTSSIRDIKFDNDSTLLHIGFIDQIIEKHKREMEFEKSKN